MIRRLFWAGLGAAVGITGYRRISRRLALLRRGGRLVSRELARGASGTWRAGGPRGAAEIPLRDAAGFLADVRAGMAEYLARYPAHPAADAEVRRPGAGRPAGRGGSHPGIDYVKDGH
jgi:hypothetical protein